MRMGQHQSWKEASLWPFISADCFVQLGDEQLYQGTTDLYRTNMKQSAIMNEAEWSRSKQIQAASAATATAIKRNKNSGNSPGQAVLFSLGTVQGSYQYPWQRVSTLTGGTWATSQLCVGFAMFDAFGAGCTSLYNFVGPSGAFGGTCKATRELPPREVKTHNRVFLPALHALVFCSMDFHIFFHRFFDVLNSFREGYNFEVWLVALLLPVTYGVPSGWNLSDTETYRCTFLETYTVDGCAAFPGSWMQLSCWTLVVYRGVFVSHHKL